MNIFQCGTKGNSETKWLYDFSVCKPCGKLYSKGTKNCGCNLKLIVHNQSNLNFVSNANSSCSGESDVQKCRNANVAKECLKQK